jgi:hypothetical protein
MPIRNLPRAIKGTGGTGVITVQMILVPFALLAARTRAFAQPFELRHRRRCLPARFRLHLNIAPQPVQILRRPK